MNMGRGEGLAGALLSCRVKEYYLEVASSYEKARDDKPNTAPFKRRFLNWILSDEAFGDALKESLRLADDLVGVRFEALKSAGYHVVRLDFVLESRGIVGSSSGPLATVFEVGLSIDSLLGLPYYPASSLKGAARAACEDLAGDDVCDFLFGSRGRVSNVVFTDAYPIGCLQGKLCMVYTGDVVNPHYYDGGRAVISELDAMPVPIVHLSIGEGTVFSTVVGVRDDSWPRELEVPGDLAEPPVKAIIRLLGSALLSGFAARSGKGYNIARLLDEGERNFTTSIVRITISHPKDKSKEGAGRRSHGPSKGKRRRGGGRGRTRY